MFLRNSRPLQTDSSFGCDAKWGDWRLRLWVGREVSQLHPLPEEGSGGQSESSVVEDLQELRGDGWSWAWWELKLRHRGCKNNLNQYLIAVKWLVLVDSLGHVDTGKNIYIYCDFFEFNKSVNWSKSHSLLDSSKTSKPSSETESVSHFSSPRLQFTKFIKGPL